jgi:two-component system cell cycle response regulator
MISTVLIVDGVATNRIVMKVKLGAAGYRTLTAADAQSCMDIARAERPDLILLDYTLAGQNGVDGMALLRMLRADPATAQLQVLMLSACEDADARMAALRAGADEFLSKRIGEQTLFARMRSLARDLEDTGAEGGADRIGSLGFAEPRKGFHHPGLIAIVTARPETGLHWRHALAPFTHDRFVFLAPDQVFRPPSASGPMPDVYLINSGLGEAGSGLKVMSALLSRPETRHSKVCILDTGTDPAMAAMAYDLGAGDLVSEAQNAEEIALRLTRLVRLKSEADLARAAVKDNLRLAMFDPLTGIANRRSGLSQLDLIAERSAATGQDFALLVLDLDRFKSVNDRFGHAAGDAVLVEVVQRLARCLRTSDLIARIGGEEFLICLPDTTLSDSYLVAERLCREIEATPVPLNKNEALQVTISIGLALSHCRPGNAPAPQISEIFDRADRALLTAKSAGRNRVTISRSAA